MFTVEDGWLAGIIEGEGCIDTKPPTGPGRSRLPRLRISMADEDVVARVARQLGQSYRQRKVYGNSKPQWTVEITGRRALELLQRLEPLFGARRAAAVRELVG